MAEVVPISKEPTYKASDIVTQVQLSVDVGGGKMVLATHVLNVDGVNALREKLDELTAASDWVSAKYGLRNLRLQLEQEEKQLLDFRDQRANTELKWQTEFGLSGRKGEFRPSESQRNVLSNYDNSIASRRTVIEKLRKDIAITEAILAGRK